MTAKKIIAALGGLSPTDLRLVSAAVNKLLADKPLPVSTPSNLYGVVQAASGSKLPFARFKETGWAKHWNENEDLVIKFIKDTWPQVTKHVDILALMRYLVGLLVEDLRRCDLPIKLGLVASNLHTIPDVYEYAFPGYRAAGLNHLVLGQVVR